jgi:outer membrane protein TolC
MTLRSLHRPSEARLGARASLLVALLALLPAASAAQVEIMASPDSALAETLAGIEGEPITLESAIASAYENATRAREAEAIAREAEGLVRREKGAFDPELFAGAEKRSDEFRSTSPFETVDSLDDDTTNLSAGVRTQLPFGTELEASLLSSRFETNSSFTTVNPQYDAAGRLAVRQPLLKGFGPGTSFEKSSAERTLEAAEATRDDYMLRVREETEVAYWDLYAAARNHAVQVLIRNQSRSFVAETETREKTGLVGPGQVANARVFLAEQELNALDTEEIMDARSDRLGSLIGRRPMDVRYRPVDEPAQNYSIESEDAAVARALESNLTLRALERDVAAVREELKGAKWNALPDLDVLGTLGGNGLAGDGQDVSFGDEVFPSNIRGDESDAYDQVFGGDYPFWSVGVEMSLPIPLREGRGERDRLEALVDRGEEQLEAERRALEDAVRARHREVVNGERRLEVAREGVDAAVEQVRIGLIEYRAGRTTAFEIVRLGADLATAQDRLSQALVRTAKSEAALRRLISEEGN